MEIGRIARYVFETTRIIARIINVQRTEIVFVFLPPYFSSSLLPSSMVKWAKIRIVVQGEFIICSPTEVLPVPWKVSKVFPGAAGKRGNTAKANEPATGNTESKL